MLVPVLSLTPKNFLLSLLFVINPRGCQGQEMLLLAPSQLQNCTVHTINSIKFKRGRLQDEKCLKLATILRTDLQPVKAMKKVQWRIFFLFLSLFFCKINMLPPMCGDTWSRSGKDISVCICMSLIKYEAIILFAKMMMMT